MTKQIEQAYRNNRRRSWLLIAAVVTLAAVAIPIASGAPDKNYTLAYAVATQSSPLPDLTRPALCTSTPDQTVTLYLTNTAKSASLGSAEIALPIYATGATAFKKVTPTSTEAAVSGSNLTYNQATDKLTLKNLGLAKYGSVRVVVAVNPTSVDSPSSPNIGAIVKQSNEFNDSSGSANLFADPAFPTLTVQDCFGTISGQVWNDQNENGAKDIFEAYQVGAGVATPWTIQLFRRSLSGNIYTQLSPSATLTLTYPSVGQYLFAGVPLNREYVVCVTQPANDLGYWTQSKPTVSSAPCTGEPNGQVITSFNQNQVDKDFGNVRSTFVATCNGTANTNPAFTVQGGDVGNCKSIDSGPTEYVYEKWEQQETIDGQLQTVYYAAFHPKSGDGVCDLGKTVVGGCTYFVQKMIWGFKSSQQPDQGNRSLNYDDQKNANGAYQYEAMKYCKMDPRTSGSELGLAALGTPKNVADNVLPNGTRTVDTDVVLPRVLDANNVLREVQSSCLITSTESTTTDGNIKRVDLVFTAVDGRSNIG